MSSGGRHPMASAIEWVAKITTIGLEMVVPGIFGQWLDGRWGTQFLGLLGFAFGVTFGIWHLLQMTPANNKHRPPGGDRPDSSD